MLDAGYDLSKRYKLVLLHDTPYLNIPRLRVSEIVSLTPKRHPAHYIPRDTLDIHQVAISIPMLKVSNF